MRDGSPRKPCGMILPPPAPRNRGRGKRRASPPPAEPSPFGNPLPGTPLHQSELPKGEGSLGAIYPERLRGEDAARGRPSPRPSGHGACKPLPLLRSRLPPKGAPRIERREQRSNDSGIGFTPPLRSSVKPLFWLGHNPCKEMQGSRPRTRPPNARDRLPLLRAGRLPRAPIRPGRAPRRE